MRRIGVDLGTTNTVAAVDDHVLHIGQDGEATLPSVVAFLPNGSVQTGAVARRRRSIDGTNTIFSTKRIIGRRFDDATTREFCTRYPFDVVDAGDNTPVFQTRAGQHSPTDIASILLREVVDRVGAAAADAEVVITVPTAFLEPQQAATLKAGREAGFRDLRLVEEPVATAFAYRSDPDLRGTVAVYDLGGGTFDVCVLDCSRPTPKVLSRGSDPFLGGDDVDLEIANWVTQEVLKRHNWDLTNYAEVEVRLLVECERAKIRLSTESETAIDLSEVDPECPLADGDLILTRSDLDRLCIQLVQRTFVTCDNVLRDAKVRAGELNAVLLAGGSTQVPAVAAAVEAYFGRAGLMEIAPTEVVARGASLA